jgi:PTS system nitrogen regulatory IIA component
MNTLNLPPELLVVERVGCQAEATSKKRVLQMIGQLLAGASPELTQDAVFDRLLERERLGSTGLGHGVALPHARVAGVHEAVGAFLKLDTAVDYDAIDSRPVDLVFGLLVPEEATQAHLDLLASLAALFSSPNLCARLRADCTPEQVLAALLSPRPEHV